MATPRNGFLVYVANGPPVFVLNETDARTYPGRVTVQNLTVVAGENLGEFLPIDRALGVLTFDKSASNARKALRIAAREKLTVEERSALGLADVEVISP